MKKYKYVIEKVGLIQQNKYKVWLEKTDEKEKGQKDFISFRKKNMRINGTTYWGSWTR